MSSKLCLEIPQPLMETLLGLSKRLGRTPEELISKAIQNYVELASEIDRIYYTKSFENCEEDVEEEKIEKLREVLGKYRSIGRWLK